MEVVGEFYNRAIKVLHNIKEYNYELIFVNDGSSDETPIILNNLADKNEAVKVLHLASNQGHQIAISAGLDYALGDIVVIIDADLQDPPEVAIEMIEKIKEGYQVVHAQRKGRPGETMFKRFTAWCFYKLMNILAGNNLVENCGDFRAFSKPVLKVVRCFRERHRFMRGIFSSIGFRQCIIQYDRDARYAGETKYPITKMINLAIDAVLSFSSSPIKLIIWISFILWAFSFIYLGKALIDHFIYEITVPGWTSIIILLIFFTGLILFSLGIIGFYVGKIFEQGQQRPLYWLSDAKNISSEVTDNEAREVKLSFSSTKISEK